MGCRSSTSSLQSSPKGLACILPDRNHAALLAPRHRPQGDSKCVGIPMIHLGKWALGLQHWGKEPISQAHRPLDHLRPPALRANSSVRNAPAAPSSCAARGRICGYLHDLYRETGEGIPSWRKEPSPQAHTSRSPSHRPQGDRPGIGGISLPHMRIPPTNNHKRGKNPSPHHPPPDHRPACLWITR